METLCLKPILCLRVFIIWIFKLITLRLRLCRDIFSIRSLLVAWEFASMSIGWMMTFLLALLLRLILRLLTLKLFLLCLWIRWRSIRCQCTSIRTREALLFMLKTRFTSAFGTIWISFPTLWRRMWIQEFIEMW